MISPESHSPGVAAASRALTWEDRCRKTARGPVALTTDRSPGPDRPHLSEIAPLIDRFRSYFTPGGSDECWPWHGPTFPTTGYGKISRSSRYRTGQHLLAHRVSWVVATGRDLTGNLTIDHTCNNKLCVNPRHLEPVTLQENVRRKNQRLGNEIGSKKYADVRVTCGKCGLVLRRDGVRRHQRRKHGVV